MLSVIPLIFSAEYLLGMGYIRPFRHSGIPEIRQVVALACEHNHLMFLFFGRYVNKNNASITL